MIHLNLKIIYIISVIDLIRRYVRKYIDLLTKSGSLAK